ncbi:MAG: isoaspartyl peptidase/L-asparaginase [Pirellulales bacterium]
MPFAIALHGGAGVDPAKHTAEELAAYDRGLRTALAVGMTILEAGGSAIEAVEWTVRALEDDPLFNAGRGAVLNAAGRHELDAAIMDGRTRRCGAVGCVTTIRNPITLARLVMTETPHVLLVGPGAERFADEQAAQPDLDRVSNNWFTTPERRAELERKRAAASRPDNETADRGQESRGTVGCVALDLQGHLAAATSTGGMVNKRLGRLGDTPIIGAGTYADDATCAVSCTGAGEEFIRVSAAFHIAALMRYNGLSLADAAQRVMFDELTPDAGGLIAVDRAGNVALPVNAPGMHRAARDANGTITVAIGRK